MPRFQPVAYEQAPQASQTMLDQVRQKFGGVPNIFHMMAHSPAVLGSYLQFSGQMAQSSLGDDLREQLALAIAGENHCGYCASAHTAIGSGLKVDSDELRQNLHGQSADSRIRAAINFALKIVRDRGRVTDQDVAEVREAGFTDAEVLEIVATVALTILTNYFNLVAETEIDFPRVERPT